MTNIDCAVKSCDREARKRGLCETDYERQRRYGDVREHDPIKEICPGSPCSVSGCERPYVAKGLCQAHYVRRQKYGDILEDIPIRPQAPNGSGSTTPQGYRVFSK